MYDVVIVGAGPGGIFTAYELLEKRPDLKIAVFEMGNRDERINYIIYIHKGGFLYVRKRNV